MKKIINNIYLVLLAFFAPVKTVEHLEFWSKKSRKSSIENDNLDSAIEKATDLQHLEEESLESYEADSLEDFDDSFTDAYEAACLEENLDSSSENLTRAQRNRVSRRMRSKKGRAGSVYAAKRTSGKLIGSMKNVDGQITLNITRLANANNAPKIPYDLPVQIFNSLDGFCNSPLVNQFLPSPDVQFLGGYVDATFTNFIFRYRQISTNYTENILVSCNEVSYVKLLFGLMVDTFVVTGGTVKISDETMTAQFDKKFTFSSQNILGKQDSNPLNMGSFIRPDNFRKDIANILIQFPVNKQRGFIFTTMYITGQPVGYQLTTTFFLNLNQIRIKK